MIYAAVLALVLGINAVVVLGATTGALLVTAGVFLLAFAARLLIVLRNLRREPDRGSMRIAYWPTLSRDGS